MARVKGQSSSEYLSLLAAVLVVGLAAVTLLQYFPGMGGEASATESHLYWASSIRPIGVLEATVLNGSICDAYGSLHSGYRMAIINSDPDPLYVTNLSIDGTVEEFCALNANSCKGSRASPASLPNLSSFSPMTRPIRRERRRSGRKSSLSGAPRPS